MQLGFSFLLEVLFRCPRTNGENWRATVPAEPIGDEGTAFVFKHPVAEGLWISSKWSGMDCISDLVLMRPPADAKAGRYQLSWSLVHQGRRQVWPADKNAKALGWAKLGEVTLTDEAPDGVAGVAWDTDLAWHGLGPEDLIR